MKQLLLLICVIPLIHGFCYTTSGRIDKTVTGRMIPVCEYLGIDIMDGSSFRTANCMDCKCTNGQLGCCGYGINAGVYMPPVGCKMIADGCDPIFVLESDETRDCTTGQKINLKNKPAEIKPIFPGMWPMFSGSMLPDAANALQKGMSFKYNTMFNKNHGAGFGDTTTNSLRDLLLNNGLLK